MSRKKIWIINQYAGSPYHGMEFRHYYLAKEFLKQGHEVLILSGSYSHLFKNKPEIKDDFTFEKIDGINYCWVKVPQYPSSASLGRVQNMLRFKSMLSMFPTEKTFAPDSIIVSSPSLFPVKQAKKWAKKFKAKLIFEVRDIWPLTLQELGGFSSFHPLILYMRHYEKYAYKYSDAVVSLLPGAMEHMKEAGLDPAKFHIIPNGTYEDDYTANQKKLPAEILAQIPQGKFIVGYVGTLGIANGLDHLVNAARLLKNNSHIHLVIIGEGGERNKLEKLSAGLENITFLGAINKRQVNEAIQIFDSCYIGLTREKLFRFGVSPNKLFDYMYAGKPVIYAIEAYNDYVKDAGCGISVAPESPQEVADSILLLSAKTKNELQAMGAKGKDFVKSNFTYKILAEKYLAVLS